MRTITDHCPPPPPPQVRVGSVSVCLIDDSVNRDVPLFDFSLADLQVEHHLQSTNQGVARGLFAGDYYNRGISSWEPVIEQWRYVQMHTIALYFDIVLLFVASKWTGR